MKKSSFLFAYFASFLFSLSAFAWDPVKILVLDSPIDYRHSLISPYVDTPSMNRYFFTDTRNLYGSWQQLTDFYVSEMKLTLNRKNPFLTQLIGLLDKLNDKRLSEAERKAVIVELRDNIKKDPDWEISLHFIGNYLHGTHVAALAVQNHDAEQVRLIAAPVFSREGFETYFDDLFRLLGKSLDSRAKRNIEEISLAIKEQNIKVVNMSFGTPWGETIEETLERTGTLSLLTQNPETVFVIAAGNNSTNLGPKKGESGELFPKSQIKNVIFVGALNNDKTDLADFSDYGDGVVAIAAPGSGIESACPGELRIHMDGTSMASPIVANRVAKVRYQHPELNAAESIRFLLENETYRNEALVSKITEGRSLKMDAPVEVNVYSKIQELLAH